MPEISHLSMPWFPTGTTVMLRKVQLAWFRPGSTTSALGSPPGQAPGAHARIMILLDSLPDPVLGPLTPASLP